MNQHIHNSILTASKVIGKTWPLYSFVTSNPLSGYEQLPFEHAVKTAKDYLNFNVFPEGHVYRQAWEQGAIKEAELLKQLKENGFSNAPEFYLNVLESQTVNTKMNPNHELDSMMVKWLSAFMDEGLAEWEMPNKDKGFYQAWRSLAKYDNLLGIKKGKDIPKTSAEALTVALSNYTAEEYTTIFTYHLAALPGWTGYINYRSSSNSLWQQAYPINLEDYLAVRLSVAKYRNLQILPTTEKTELNPTTEKLKYLWLKAWEASWQHELIATVSNASGSEKISVADTYTTEAQFAFCIDTRSEAIRRHVETKGNYETFGYAGFFGIAMDYTGLEDGLTRKSCPPIVSSAYTVSEAPQASNTTGLKSFKKRIQRINFKEYFLKRMKNMLPSAFGYVEGSGVLYGLSILGRTLLPGYSYRLKEKNTSSHESVCQPKINHTEKTNDHELGISLEEKVAIVKSAFDLTGWKTFAPLVLFVGHGSHTANNPFGSSLDCGACAASPGRHNARMLAKLANLPEVKKVLVDDYNVAITDNTIFIGAEHNTTTDEIIIFDAEVPESHQKQLNKLKSDLSKAQETATRERLGLGNNSVNTAHQKANNWGETRPEWGLAKNAGFIIAPRSLTKNQHLDSRCFLHSYDWEMDSAGNALEGILQGPMVVTQWINNHYYFSTVDNERFGGGSKITHNITGKFGVVQGNGGDLKMGLPLQSVHQTDTEMYHQPLRLSVLVQAPLERVGQILAKNEHLQNLLDNEWIYLMVMDPKQQNKIFKYQQNLEWSSMMDDDAIPEPEAINMEASILDEILT